MSERDVYDITIVGGGPTGLFASFYAGLRQMKTKLVDALEELGGQVAVLYPEKYIYDVGGFPKVTGKDLVKGMVEQALKFNPTVVARREDRLDQGDRGRHHTARLGQRPPALLQDGADSGRRRRVLAQPDGGRGRHQVRRPRASTTS